MTMDLEQVEAVKGLPPTELEMLKELIQVWTDKLDRNNLRNKYYNAKNKLNDLGISIPPSLKDVETVVGWPAKAVDSMAARSKFDGFTAADGSVAEDLQQIATRNRLSKLYRQAVTSELIHSCAFMTVSKGAYNEPPAIINVYSALTAAAMWDYRHKRIKCGLTVVDIDEDVVSHEKQPVWVNLYTDTDTWEIQKSGNVWTARRNPHLMGRPMMEPLAYRSSIERPFGMSRISRACISITDSAVRTALRSEVTAEFFTAPQKYLLGAEDSIFDDTSKWSAYVGNMFVVTKDEDGDVPHFGQLSQGSMEPQISYMRSLAARFSGETDIPINELGVIHDNPASAEAIFAAKEALVGKCEDLNADNGDALVEIARMAIAVKRNKAYADLTDEEMAITALFRNPSRPSMVSQADAMVKVASVAPWIADTDVFLEDLGFDEGKRQRLNEDREQLKRQALLGMFVDDTPPDTQAAE